MYFLVKCAVSGVLVGIISEVSRRYSLIGGLIASLPVVSILALCWLYRDTASRDKVIELSSGIALMVLPSIMFFVFLSLLLSRSTLSFWLCLAISCVGMIATYSAYVLVLKRLGIGI